MEFGKWIAEVGAGAKLEVSLTANSDYTNRESTSRSQPPRRTRVYILTRGGTVSDIRIGPWFFQRTVHLFCHVTCVWMCVCVCVCVSLCVCVCVCVCEWEKESVLFNVYLQMLGFVSEKRSLPLCHIALKVF